MFLELLKSVPGLEERLMNTESEEEIHSIAVMVSYPLIFSPNNLTSSLVAKRRI